MGASISLLQNSIARLLPRAPLDVDSASSFHTFYAYLTGLMLALVELKYEALNTSPFNDHPAVMILFLIVIIVYVMALLVLRSNRQISSTMIWWVCHICGILACQLLLLLLVSPIWSFIINLSSLLLLLTFLFSYRDFFFQPSQSEEPPATQVTDQVPTMPNP